MQRSTCVTFLATIMIVHGCRGEGDSRQSLISRDSAGVVIAENSPEALDSLPMWRSNSIPAVTIGVAAGNRFYELHDVRGAARLSDGRIVFLNASSKEVRFFDPGGIFLTAIGRDGMGPGEFRWPVALVRTPDDTIRVYDAAEKRITVITPAGQLARTHPARGSLSGLLGFLDSNTVATGEPSFARIQTEALLDMRTVLRIVDVTTGQADTIAVIGTRKEFQSVRGVERVLTPVPFTVYPHIDVGRGKLYVTDGARFEVRVFDTRGGLLAIYRVMSPAEPVSRQEYESIVEARINEANDNDERIDARRIYAQMSPPTYKPAFDQLIVADSGDIWVQHFEVRPGEWRTWTVFGQAGAWWHAHKRRATFAFPRSGMIMCWAGQPRRIRWSTFTCSSSNDFQDR